MTPEQANALKDRVFAYGARVQSSAALNQIAQGRVVKFLAEVAGWNAAYRGGTVSDTWVVEGVRLENEGRSLIAMVDGASSAIPIIAVAVAIGAFLLFGCESWPTPNPDPFTRCQADPVLYKSCMCEQAARDQNEAVWRNPYYECRGESPWLDGGVRAD